MHVCVRNSANRAGSTIAPYPYPPYAFGAFVAWRGHYGPLRGIVGKGQASKRAAVAGRPFDLKARQLSRSYGDLEAPLSDRRRISLQLVGDSVGVEGVPVGHQLDGLSRIF